MSLYAELDGNKRVLRVVVCDDVAWLQSRLGGTWTLTGPTTAQVQGTGPVRSGFGFLGRTYLEIMRNKETTGTLLTNAEALVTSRTG